MPSLKSHIITLVVHQNLKIEPMHIFLMIPILKGSGFFCLEFFKKDNYLYY